MSALGDGSENWPLAQYDAAEDGRRSYDFCRRCQREIAIRSGKPIEGRILVPHGETEWRWVQEGPRPFNELDTVKNDG